MSIVYIATKEDVTRVFENLEDAKSYAYNESDIKTVNFTRTQPKQVQVSFETKEEHMLKWIEKLFSKVHPSRLIGKDSLLRTYVNEFVEEYPNCNPLIIKARDILNTEYVVDTPKTLVKDSNIFKLQTIADDISEYFAKYFVEQ